LKRSTITLLREITENRTTLGGKQFERISYTINNNQTKVDYVNARLSTAAYDTVISSGYFTYYSAEIQHYLQMLYDTIKRRNDLMVYSEHFEDVFFLFDDSEERIKKWFKKVAKYDLMMTLYENKLSELLPFTEQLLATEMPK
jgi:hypothetical protein